MSIIALPALIAMLSKVWVYVLAKKSISKSQSFLVNLMHSQ